MNTIEILDKAKVDSKKVLVIGLGITGIESALFLKCAGFEPVCVESKSEEEYVGSNKFGEKFQALKDGKIETHFCIDETVLKRILKNIALCVLSPGVPLNHPLAVEVQKYEVPITSELELGVELSKAPCVIVTGSNGKSTTVTLIHTFVEAGGKKAFLCGNIGEPVIGQLSGLLQSARRNSVAAASTDPTERVPPTSPSLSEHMREILVVEASSYQLESSHSLKPRVAVFLNLSGNHLERHGSMQNYFDAKKRGFVYQGLEDFAVINRDDKWGRKLMSSTKARLLSFGFDALPSGSEGAVIHYNRKAGVDAIEILFNGQKERYDLMDSKLIGAHNRSNISAAILAARVFGISSALIQESLCKFNPLEHRLEAFYERNRRAVINDSKSTTVASTCAAVESAEEAYPGRPIVLMIGGQAKKSSWQPLLKLLAEKQQDLRGVICFGKDGGMLKRELKGVSITAIECHSLYAAVQKANELCHPGDVVLLSPGCASFDEFRDFEERGEQFKKLVKENFG